MEMEEAFDAAIQTAKEGPEEDTRTEEAPQKDVETEEAATSNDVGSPPQGSHDGSDGPKTPLSKKMFSETTDEQQVVETIAMLSIEKKVSDQVC